MSDADQVLTIEAPPFDWRALRAVVVAADAGEPGALATLRTLLDQHPDAWRFAGSLARSARTALLKDTSPATYESVQRGLRQMRDELRGEQVSPIEALAIDAILTAWVDYQMTMHRFAQLQSTSLEIADYWQRRLSQTQGRYLRAIKTLAYIRKASINLQINVAAPGGQQVNMAQQVVQGGGADEI